MFESFKYKLAFLETSPNRLLTPRLLAAVTKTLTNTNAERYLTSRQFELVALDLCYILLRHRPWLSVPLFPEVVSDYLAQMFQIPRQTGEELWEGILTHLPPDFVPPRSVRNHEFLEAVFVASATAPDQLHLEVDLGLGTTLLRHMRSTAEGLMGNRRSSDKSLLVEFPTAIEAELESIMKVMADALKVTPWLMDAYRLRYLIQSIAPDVWLPIPDAMSRLQLLLKVGQHDKTTEDKIRQWWSPQTGDATRPSLPVEQVLQQMLDAELIYQEPARSKKIGAIWRLTDLGFRLTADAYAVKQTRLKSLRFERFLRLPEPYQVAWIHRVNYQWETVLWDFFNQGMERLGPMAQAALVTRLTQSRHQQDLLVKLPQLAIKHPSSWYQRDLVQHLTQSLPAELVGRIKAGMAESAA